MAIYGLTVYVDTATPFLRLLREHVTEKRFAKSVGEAASATVKAHFAEKNRSDPHASASRLNARPSQLYADFADATSWRPTPDGVVVAVSHVAARQRFLGGTIKPVNAGALTIPAIAQAYGLYADQVGVPLKFGYAPDPDTGKWRPALIAFEPAKKATKRKRKDGSAVEKIVRPAGVYFWLVRSVTQDPDETVLPTAQALADGIMEQLSAWLDELETEADPLSAAERQVSDYFDGGAR